MNKKVFIVKVRVNEVEDNFVLPRYPEFEFVKQIGDAVWQAKSSESDKIVTITRIEKGNFFEYEVEQSTELG